LKKHSFLHEEENWGGKNLSKVKSGNHIENLPKRGKYAIPDSTVGNDELKPDVNVPKDKIKSSKRGKYVTPCPDIQNVLEKPNKNINLPLLKNG